MKHVRLGLIGLGNIGTYHADYLLKRRIERCELVAVADPNPGALAKYPALKTFIDGAELIRSGQVDAVLIATPHFQHTTLGLCAFAHGVHALVEKPISSHKVDAERLIAAHRQQPDLVFGGMFQLRAEPRYQLMRRLIREELGQLVRVNWINTDWFRTEAYYASSDWRATWKGEGGGVLLNQCLHNLDTLQWLCGMPARVRGFCQLGRFHRIEVEDNVTAYLEWAGGATGSFISSTGEAPGTNRLEIVGSKGSLLLEQERLTFCRNSVDMLEFCRTGQKGFSKPEVRHEPIPFENALAPHAALTRNFVHAILDGEPLIAPGEEGIHSVELANALLYSSLLGQTLELPMDGLAWEAKLQQLIRESTFQKQHVQLSADDFAASFRK